MHRVFYSSRLSGAKTERKPNERLRTQRLRKNWTQVYVATMIGTSDIEVSRWERGVAEPTLYFRAKLCTLFHTTPDALGFISPFKTEPEVSASGPLDSFPLPLTSLIGREQEVVAAQTLLQQANVRLLTLIGPGGVGKTHLALHIAQAQKALFTDGAAFISLASVEDAVLALPTIARALGLYESGTRTLFEHLQTFLHNKHLLLVLDNFEQVRSAAPHLVELLATCPYLKLMVTSREMLNVRCEHPFPVNPLSLPSPGSILSREAILYSGAIQLFLERVHEISPERAFTDEEFLLVTEICRRLDGLPLAIELAVSRLKLLPLSALLERLGHRLALLTGGPRDLPARQQSLRNTLTWSYDLLSETEKRLFRRFSVFHGGCTLQAIEALSAVLESDISINVLNEITSLLDKHLLYQKIQDDLEPRLMMLETIREYSQERLMDCAEGEQTQDAHAKYYLRLVEDAEIHLFGREQKYWFKMLEGELDNLRASLQYSIMQKAESHKEQMLRDETACRLAGALVRFWTVRGPFSEARLWLERVLAKQACVSPPVRAKVLSGAAWFAFLHGEVARTEQLGEECLQIYCQASRNGALQDLAFSLLWVRWLALQQNKENMIHTLLEQGRTVARDYHNKQPLAFLLYFMGEAAIELGKYSEAYSFLEESLALFYEQQNEEDIAWALLCLGYVLFAQAEEEHAGVYVERSLQLFREIENKVGIVSALYLLGRLALSQKNVDKAQSWLEEALELSPAVGILESTVHILSQLACLALSQGKLPEAQSLWKQTVSLLLRSGDNESLRLSLECWGCQLAQQGQTILAVRLWGMADALEHSGDRRSSFLLMVRRTTTEQALYEQQVRAARAQLGEDAFARIWEEGRRLSPEQALAAGNLLDDEWARER